MASKRKILEAVTRECLLAVARDFEISGLTGKNRAGIVDALVAARSVSAEAILGTFGRDDLKTICRYLGLDETGRAKQVLIDRLLGRTETSEETTKAVATKEPTMAKKKPTAGGDGLGNVEDYRHKGAKRKNNPPANIAAEGTVPVMPKIEYSYSPRRPPTLRFDATGQADKLPELLAEATRRKLTTEETRSLAEALRTQEPWLEWAAKRESEASGLVVDPVALHIHERISAQAILKVAARQDVQRSLFSDPEQEYQEAVQFYRHDIDWTNRLILGDSLQVMASLARREDLACKVQMIYIDPPYGIKYGSNFQPEVGRRDVKDKDADLTRELEMVKAYRDIWHLGIHSYLSYLRDRLIVAKELLADTGSIFVQISEENLHRVRSLMDEVLGGENCCGCITFIKTAGQPSDLLSSVADYLLWYCKDISKVKYHKLYRDKGDLATLRDAYSLVMGKTGEVRTADQNELDDYSTLRARYSLFRLSPMSSQRPPGSFPVPFQGREFLPGKQFWKTDIGGVKRLEQAERLHPSGKTLFYRLFLDDFGGVSFTNVWTDTQASFADKIFVVQTSTKVVARCLLMTTDPGDLVLDPTCGSGTTAFVAEKWGRRWITADTSRVAVAIARQRLLTARFEFYQLRAVEPSELQSNPNNTWLTDPGGKIKGHCTFDCETVPHITLKSVAQNPNLDPIFAKHETVLAAKLAACNTALAKVTADIRRRLELKLLDKQRAQGKRAITDSDRRRWELPEKDQKWEHWTVPFDTDPDWPKETTEAVTAYRMAWRAKMDEVNACIAANAEQEELVDQPEVVKGVVRVSGPFTVEAVQPPELSLGDVIDTLSPIGGEPESLDTFAPACTVRVVQAKNEFEVQNVEAYLDQMVKLLRMDGVRFPNNKEMVFTRMERIAGSGGVIHAEGRWVPKGDADADLEGRASVAVVFGPQYGPVTAKQVEELIRAASRRGYDDLVVAGFSFDGPAQAVINEAQHPKLRIHMAYIRPDVNPGMNGLLKEQPGSQLFTVFGLPRITVNGPNKQGQYSVVMEGVDVYNPVDNSIISTGANKVAAWFLDGDYDDRTFCITQAFFPDKSAWEKLAKALGGVVDPERFEALSGTVSLPFPRGKHRCAAVKVIDPRGNEVMQVHKLA